MQKRQRLGQTNFRRLGENGCGLIANAHRESFFVFIPTLLTKNSSHDMRICFAYLVRFFVGTALVLRHVCGVMRCSVSTFVDAGYCLLDARA